MVSNSAAAAQALTRVRTAENALQGTVTFVMLLQPARRRLQCHRLQAHCAKLQSGRFAVTMTLPIRTTCVLQGHRVAEAFVFLLEALFVGAPGKLIVLQELLAVAQRAAQPPLFVAETKTHAPAPAVHFRRQEVTSNAVQLPSPIVAAAVVVMSNAFLQMQKSHSRMAPSSLSIP